MVVKAMVIHNLALNKTFALSRANWICLIDMKV